MRLATEAAPPGYDAGLPRRDRTSGERSAGMCGVRAAVSVVEARDGELEMKAGAEGGGARRSWRSLRRNPDYVAEWLGHGGPVVHEAPPFQLRRQTVADLKAGRWNLLAWEDPGCPARAALLWAYAPMVEARVVESGHAGKYALCRVVLRSGARFMGLRLRDGTLIVKIVRGR